MRAEVRTQRRRGGLIERVISSAVMWRELRAEARRPLNFRLRSVVAGVGIVGIGLLLSAGQGAGSGFMVFAQFHTLSMAVIGLMAPLLTADTISRERRHGTLPLLFLTPLSGRQIVATKFAVQFLRGLGYWLALLPIAVLPLMLGGVRPGQVVTLFAVQSLTLALGLAGGIWASSLGRRFLPTAAGALGLAGLLWFLGVYFVTILLVWGFGEGMSLLLEVGVIAEVGEALSRPSGGAQQLIGGSLFHAAIAATAIVVVLALPGLFRRWGARLAREQTGGGESARTIWFRETFLRPRMWKRAFYRTMARRMAANPLIWLEYRHAWSRAARWAMVGALIAFYSGAISSDWGDFWNQQVICLGVFGLLMCFSAASSFQNERETGAFELLLVAPFREEDLFWGRVRAMWSYYGPVLFGIFFAMFCAMAVLPSSMGYRGDSGLAGYRILALLLSFLLVPVAGLYFALRFRQFTVVLAMTAFSALILPTFLPEIASFVLSGSVSHVVHVFLGVLVLLLLALEAYLLRVFSEKAIERLRRRSFAQ